MEYVIYVHTSLLRMATGRSKVGFNFPLSRSKIHFPSPPWSSTGNFIFPPSPTQTGKGDLKFFKKNFQRPCHSTTKHTINQHKTKSTDQTKHEEKFKPIDTRVKWSNKQIPIHTNWEKKWKEKWTNLNISDLRILPERERGAADSPIKP